MRTSNHFCAAKVCTFFIDCQSLRELRITSIIIIAIARKDVCEVFKCNGLIVFSQRGGKFKKSTTHMLPHPLFPPPYPRLLSLVPPLPSSSPHLRCCWPKQSSAPAHLQGCSPVMMGDPSVVTDAVSYLMDQSRGKPCQSVGVGSWPAATPPPPSGPLVSLSQGHGDRGGGKGGVVKPGFTRGSYIRSLWAGVLEKIQDLLDVTWTVSFFLIIVEENSIKKSKCKRNVKD